MEINKIKIPDCTKILEQDKCSHNIHCKWNHIKCENNDETLFDHYVKIVRSKSGKNELQNIAEKLNVKYQDRTIKHICDDLQEVIHVAMHGNTIQTIAKKLKLKGTNESELYYKIYKHIFDKLIESNNKIRYEIHEHILHTLPIIPGYVNFNTDKVVYKNEYNFTQRLEYVDKIKAILAKYTNKELCDFKKGFEKVKKIGSKSVYGEAYLGYNGDFKLPIFIAIKVMPVNNYNLNEIDKYDLFVKYVIENKSPHFPIIYKSNICTKCHYDNPTSRHLNENENCITILNELANGDLKSFLSEKHTSYEIVSIFGQLLMANFALEKESLVHHDMHWGNFLYHNVKEYKGKYLHYKIGYTSFITNKREIHDVYIKNNGIMFIAWDFSDMKHNNYIHENLHTDVYRIFHINNFAIESGFPEFPKEADEICTSIRRIARDQIYSVGDVIIKFKEMLQNHKSKRLQQLIYIDPSKPPPQSKIINAKPYTIL